MGANLTETTGRGQGADEDEVVAVSGAMAAVNRGGRRWGFRHRGVGLQREEGTKKKTSSPRKKNESVSWTDLACWAACWWAATHGWFSFFSVSFFFSIF
jgi:hypothetical protein